MLKNVLSNFESELTMVSGLSVSGSTSKNVAGGQPGIFLGIRQHRSSGFFSSPAQFLTRASHSASQRSIRKMRVTRVFLFIALVAGLFRSVHGACDPIPLTSRCT